MTSRMEEELIRELKLDDQQKLVLQKSIEEAREKLTSCGMNTVPESERSCKRRVTPWFLISQPINCDCGKS